MGFASWKDRKAIAASLRSIYRAENAETGLAALEAFKAGPWGEKFQPSPRAGAGTGSK